MESTSVERRLSAIVAMDVVGYSRLMGVDERGTLRALKAHRTELLEPSVAAHRGRIVKSTGDGFLLEFASVVDAIACAVEVQRGMLVRNAESPEDRRIVFRMGVNIGDIIVDAGDIFGDGVNVAARLETLCEPGGICISRAANEQVRDKLSLSFADLGEHLVKNISRAVGVYGLSASQIASLPGAPASPKRPRVAGTNHRRTGVVAAGAALVVAGLIAAGWWYADSTGLLGQGDLETKLADALGRSLPGISEKARAEAVAAYVKSNRSRALAVAPRAGRMWRTTGWPDADVVRERVLERCQQYYDEPCVLVAVDDTVLPPGPSNATTLWDMPRVRYQGPYDVTRIPALRDKDLQRADVTGYKTAPGPKAAAFHAEGIFRIVTGAASQTAAEEQALQACNADPARRSGMSLCVLYAAGDRVVLPMRATAPIAGGAAPVALKPAPIAKPGPTSVPTPPANTVATTLNATLSKAAPTIGETARASIVSAYLQERQNRALAALPPAATWRSAAWANAAIAEERTLESCQLRYGSPCVLVAVNDTVQATPGDGNWPRRDMPRMAYGGEFDIAQLPIVNESVRARLDVAGYRVQPAPKAAAIHPLGKLFVTVGAADQREAERKALSDCNTDPERSGAEGPCYLYAVGDRVVLRQRATEPLSKPPEAKPALPAENPLAATISAILTKAAPSLSEATRTNIASLYVQERQHKALAVYPPSATWRFVGVANAAMAEERTLEGCQLRYGGPCLLVIVNDSPQSPAADGNWPRRDMPRLAYDGEFDPKQVPTIGDAIRQRADVAGYRQQQGPKAVALHPQGRVFVATGAASQRGAEQKALAECNDDPQRAGRDGPCFLYAASDQVVLRQRRTTPLTAAP
jgi:class 3 adenylate cyclase